MVGTALASTISLHDVGAGFAFVVTGVPALSGNCRVIVAAFSG